MKGLPLLFACAFCAISINAATIHVPADQPTIQAGIDVAVDGDTVLVYPGQYFENTNFNGRNIVLGSLFLTSGDTSYVSATIIDGDWSGTVVRFENGEDSGAAIIGFTLQNGYYYPEHGGGVYCDYSHPTIQANTITNNEGAYGGGIYCNHSNAKIKGNFIINNKALRSYGTWKGWSEGGGIYCHASDPTIAGNTIAWNRGSQGGGIYCSLSNAIVTDNVISDNSAILRGGGLCYYDSSPTMSGNLIAKNEVWAFGSPCFGGGMYCNSSELISADNTFSTNSADSGGSMYFRGDCTLTVENSIIAFGARGAALLCDTFASIVVTCCNIYSNAGGDWIGCIAGQDTTNGNFSADPLFCDTVSGDFRIASNSPCAPWNNDCGVLIGALESGCSCCAGIRGNVDGDGEMNVADLTYLVDYLFFNGPPPPCPEEGDVNGNGAINVADFTYLVDYLFLDGPAPPPC